MKMLEDARIQRQGLLAFAEEGSFKKKKKERKRQRSRKKFKLGSLSLSMQAFGTRDNLGEDFY